MTSLFWRDVSGCGSDVRFPYVWCILVRFPNGKLYWFELKPDVYMALHGLNHLGPLILEVKDKKPSAAAAAADRWVTPFVQVRLLLPCVIGEYVGILLSPRRWCGLHWPLLLCEWVPPLAGSLRNC